MSDKSNIKNYIIVLGTTKSGSNAVYDYLAGRGDIHNPLMGVEYQLPQMPNGLMTLEAIANNAFHPHTSDYVLAKFEETTKVLSQSCKLWRYGKNYSSMIPLFDKAIEEFISEICVAKLPMRLHWHKLIQSNSPMIYLINNIINRLGFNRDIPYTRLLTSDDNIVLAAQKLHRKIFETVSDERPILLNQAGSGWNPIESTKFFLNRKVILVTRNPLDQFAELKQYKKAISVKGFIYWYKEMQFRLMKIKNPIVLRLKFEDFVNENEKMTNILCDHSLLSPNVRSKYNPKFSEKNIRKYQSILNKEEIDLIKNSLSEYLYVK